MNSKAFKTPLFMILLIGAFLSIALMGTTHVTRFEAALERQLSDRAQLFITAFSEQVSIYLLAGRESDLEPLTHMVVMGDIIYAQVVQDGAVLAEASTSDMWYALPPPEPQTEMLTMGKRQLESDSILDISMSKSAGSQGESSSYVRLGLSLGQIRSETNQEILWVVGFGFLSLIFLMGLGLMIRSHSMSRVISESAAAEIKVSQKSIAQAGNGHDVFIAGPLQIDDRSKEVSISGNPVQLSQKEYRLLALLASDPDRVFSNEEIKSEIWSESYVSPEDIKKYIYFLRQKVEPDPKSPQIVLTVKGFGYKLSADPI